MTNREIKFRAWDSISKQIWIPDFISNGGLAGMSLGTKEHPNDVVYDSDRFPIMQYTGLKDKNGKEIYEGDILKYKTSPNYTVGYSNGEFVMTFESPNGSGQISLREDKTHFMEVIGNIWENGDLLK